MSKILQRTSESGAVSVRLRPELAVRPEGWLAGAARALGLFARKGGGGGRGFDFAGMHRSLSTLEQRSPGEE